jgi:dTDP-4-dehydrorhamnose 3,5-epimerase
VFRLEHLDAVHGPVQFVQLNHSRSTRGALRGLHAENWEKLVYVCSGEVFIALADIRPESATFGQIDTFRVDAANPCWIFVPRGIAHGYCVLSDVADYLYQVTAYYDGTDRRAVAWDDPDLAVPWPISSPVLSERDMRNPRLRDLFPERYRHV